MTSDTTSSVFPVPPANEPAGVVVPSPESLTSRTSKGFAWMAFQTLGTKVGSVSAQLVLSWLLSQKDFGVFATVVLTTSFAQVLQQNGLKQILIQRQARFARWVHAAFWTSAAISLLACLSMSVMAPIIAYVFDEKKLFGVTLLVALASLLDGIAVVPNAILERDLRFSTIAKIGLISNLSTSALSVLFALGGAGVYCLALPLPIVSIVRTAYLFHISHYRPVRRFYFSRWRFLLPDSMFLMGTSLAATVVYQGDNLSLRIFHNVEVLGVYYYAFGLSTQAMQLVSGSLGSILMPAFTKLGHDLVRQKNACVRASRILLLVGVPLCYLQSALARPLLEFAFGQKWEAAVPVLQILSIALSISLVSSCTAGALQAQGRFRFFFVWSLSTALFFLCCVTTGALLGASVSVAVAVGIYHLFTTPLGLYFALLPGKGCFVEVIEIYLRPVLCSTAALTGSLLLQNAMKTGPLLKGVAGFAVFAGIVGGAYWVFARKDVDSLIHILRDMKARLRRRA